MPGATTLKNFGLRDIKVECSECGLGDMKIVETDSHFK